MVCRTTKREREWKKEKKTIKGEGKQKKGKKDERDRDKERMKSKRRDKVIERGRETERKKREIKVWFRQHDSGLWVFTVKSVCCEIVTIESFCVRHHFDSFSTARFFLLLFFSCCCCCLFVPYRFKTKIHDSHLVIQACSSEQEVQIGLSFFFSVFFFPLLFFKKGFQTEWLQ